MKSGVLIKFQQILWYLMIAMLPITSMPLVGRILGSDSVASPAILILLPLIVLWLNNGIKSKLWVSNSVWGLVIFCLLANTTSLISVFRIFPIYKDFDSFRSIINSMGTLVIGLLFFVSASSIPARNEIKTTTLKIINASGSVILLWSFIQAVSWYTRTSYPQWMFDFQGIFSSRVLYRQRVTGFALEPSWLAHQMNLLYLPYWLSATLLGYSSHEKRIIGISFENILLAGGICTLALTLSRVGFAAFLLMIELAIIYFHSFLVENVYRIILKKINQCGFLTKSAISVFFLIVYIIIILTMLYVYSRTDPRMQNILNLSLSQDHPLLRIFNELQFGDRVIYWLTGWNIFNDYPILGVGIGNAGFFFPKKIPGFGWTLVEVRRLIYRSHILLNIKSLWFRLLAETGISGFAIFTGWLISMVSGFLKKFQNHQDLEKTLGMMGGFTLLALVFEGFSIDSFAMPYWWIALGFASSIEGE